MLTNELQTRNWSATSEIESLGAQGNPVLYLNASYAGNDINITKNVRNTSAYKAHKQECDADYAEFEAKVYADIGE